MGFFKKLYEGGKQVLGKVVGAGKLVQHLRDKGLSLLDKAKSIPVLGSALDAGISAVMNTPVGTAIRTGNKILNAGVAAGDAALSAMRAHEGSTGTPTYEQLREVGRHAIHKMRTGMNPPAEDAANPRLDALKGE